MSSTAINANCIIKNAPLTGLGSIKTVNLFKRFNHGFLGHSQAKITYGTTCANHQFVILYTPLKFGLNFKQRE